MIILYVPFGKENAGDLPPMVEKWQKNHQHNSETSIKIRYYGEPFEISSDNESLEVYVCAHGAPTRDIISNQLNEKNAECINAAVLAYRFDEDFKHIKSSIESIHLYQCGKKYKNRESASTFQLLLSSSYTQSIYFYHGILFGADDNGKLYGRNGDKKFPISQLKGLAPGYLVNNNLRRRIPIKEESFIKFFDYAKERKYEVLKERRDKKKNAILARQRMN